MRTLRRNVYMAAGHNTVSMGTGRREFHPKKPRPGLEDYISEAGRGVLRQVGGAQNVDEGVIGNFMAARFNNQGNLAALIPAIDEGLRLKPCTRVEGACCSGALALVSGIKSVLAETAEVVLAVGVEVQNSVKALYGADILATAGWSRERQAGHAYFFPGKFSDRAGAYFERYGRERTRRAMARWYRNAIENARGCPTAQEYHNTAQDLEALALSEPTPRTFVDHLNVYDCSKVSDGASAIAILSEEGLERAGIAKKDAVEVLGIGQVQADLTRPPDDPTQLGTLGVAVERAFRQAGIDASDVGTVETHDCFTIAGLQAVEAIGFAGPGEGPDLVADGTTARTGRVPFNTTGGLIGWGHPTGATGVHQAVTIWQQLTCRADGCQIALSPARPYGLSINMGGDDKTLVAIVYRRGE